MADPRDRDGRHDVHTFPSADRAFAREVKARLDGDRPRSPEELERLLRPRFGRVAVRRRVLSDESRTTWYVFRDGRVLPM